MHYRIPPSKTGWPSLNLVIFPPVLRHVLDDPKSDHPGIIDQTHELIWDDYQISAKSIAEQLGISREWVGFHHSWRFAHMEALREVGPEMPERRSETSMVPVLWANFGFFSAGPKLFPVAIGDHWRNLVISLWPGDKVTMN